MSSSNGTFFRIEKNSNYTVMSNHHLQNTALTLKAKGLLSLMLSLPDNWDFSMNGLVSICGDGLGSVKSGVLELEKHGYIRREQDRNSNGQMGRMKYIVSELPMASNGFDSEFVPQVEKPPTVNPSAVFPLADNHLQSNTKELSTNQSITKSSQVATAPNRQQENRLDELEQKIKNQIGYDLLIKSHKQQLIDNIVEILLEISLLDSRQETFYKGRDKYNAELVKRRLSNLTYEQLHNWLTNEFYSIDYEIKSLDVYIFKSLYNLKTTNAARENIRWQSQKPKERNASYDLEALEKMISKSSVWD